jgi:hypothetical protein
LKLKKLFPFSLLPPFPFQPSPQPTSLLRSAASLLGPARSAAQLRLAAQLAQLRALPPAVSDARGPHVSVLLAPRRACDRDGVELGLSSDSAFVPRARSPGDPTPLFKAPSAPCTTLSHAPRPPPLTLARPRRRRLGPRRRHEPVPPPSFACLCAAQEIRREVRKPPVPLEVYPVHHLALAGSPEFHCRHGSPCTSAPRRRHPSSSQWCSPFAPGRSGVFPASIGAP